MSLRKSSLYLIFIAIQLFSCVSENNRFTYYQNGKIKSKLFLKKNGNRIEYKFYQNGNIESKTVKNKKGQFHLYQYEYYKSGNILTKKMFWKGKPCGDNTVYFINGFPALFNSYDIEGKSFFVLECTADKEIESIKGCVLSRKYVILTQDNKIHSNVSNKIKIIYTNPNFASFKIDSITFLSSELSGRIDTYKIINSKSELIIDFEPKRSGDYSINVYCKLQSKIIENLNLRDSLRIDLNAL